MHKYFYHVLLIEKNEQISGIMKQVLEQNGYLIHRINCHTLAQNIMIYFKFDIIIIGFSVDIENKNSTQNPDELPCAALEIKKNIEKITFIQNIRQTLSYKLPIIAFDFINITKLKNHIDKKILILGSGVDDYIIIYSVINRGVIKSFDLRETLVKIKNFINLYKNTESNNEVLQFGNSFFDTRTKILIKNNKIIFFTKSELNLIKILIEAKTTVSRQTLSKLMNINARSVDVQINRVRTKIEDDKKNPKFLQTIRNEGYILYY